jgi:hypothetical protein
MHDFADRVVSDVTLTPDPPRRLPASGNIALAASAVIQAVIGMEFVLNGLNKFADPHYFANFKTFVTTSPGSHRGILAPILQALVIPHADFFALAARAIELIAGLILLVGAAEIARRRLSGRLGTQHPYEPLVALASAAAGFAVAGLTLGIFLTQGGAFIGVNPARAFGSSIPVELLLVPFGLAIAWLELGRFSAIRHSRRHV